jgi:PPOX class probable F420-dependent enzyme
MSRRDQIRMSTDEVRAFLDAERTVTCATIGRDGRPHLMPLWYVRRGEELWAWTYAKSQKVRNLDRDPRATLQVEAGTEYHLLRGVMLETDVVVHRDLDTVTALGLEIFTRYGGGGELSGDARAAVTAQAAKRVGLQFVERNRVTWDHRKLAGVY